MRYNRRHAFMIQPLTLAIGIGMAMGTLSSPARADIPVMSANLWGNSGSKSMAGGGSKPSSKGSSSQGTFLMGGSFLFLQNQTTQDGEQMPGGTTLLSQFNAQYDLLNYYSGAGLVYQYDKMGSQTNTAYGAKLEAIFGSYFGEVGYAIVTQTFTGRAVQQRTGTQMFYGAGMRFHVLTDYFYFEAGVRQRVTTMTKQDGETMVSPLIEKVMTPFMGLGVNI